MSTKIINNIIETYLSNGTEAQKADLRYSLKFLQDASKKEGVELACAISEQYDVYSSHPLRVSDCVRSKLNQLNRKHIRKNKLVPYKTKKKKTAKKKS
jgi:hypothetical protein